MAQQTSPRVPAAHRDVNHRLGAPALEHRAVDCRLARVRPVCEGAEVPREVTYCGVDGAELLVVCLAENARRENSLRDSLNVLLQPRKPADFEHPVREHRLADKRVFGGIWRAPSQRGCPTIICHRYTLALGSSSETCLG